MCRERIRSLLRQRVNEEHPDLTELPKPPSPPLESRHKERKRSSSSRNLHREFEVIIRTLRSRAQAQQQYMSDEESSDTEVDPILQRILRSNAPPPRTVVFRNLRGSPPEPNSPAASATVSDFGDEATNRSGPPKSCSVTELVFDGDSDSETNAISIIGLKFLTLAAS